MHAESTELTRSILHNRTRRLQVSLLINNFHNNPRGGKSFAKERNRENTYCYVYKSIAKCVFPPSSCGDNCVQLSPIVGTRGTYPINVHLQLVPVDTIVFASHPRSIPSLRESACSKHCYYYWVIDFWRRAAITVFRPPRGTAPSGFSSVGTICLVFNARSSLLCMFETNHPRTHTHPHQAARSARFFSTAQGPVAIPGRV